jgi:hypothetical protein
MKNKIFPVLAAMFLAAAVNAQTDTTELQTDTTQLQNEATQLQTEVTTLEAQTDTAKTEVATTATTAPVSNMVTLDSNLPENLKGVTSSTVQPKHYLPVLGSYSTADAATNLTITVDEQNVGIVWIDGLPQGKVKAFLKKAPATYKIPAQKTAEGKSVAEGTLVYDKDSKQLWLCTDCAFNEADPAATFTSGKTKAKVWQLNKVDETAAVETIQQQ